MFLPEIYGLEYTVPADAIRSVERRQGLFGGERVRVTIERGAKREERFELFLRDPEAFIDALERIRQRVGLPAGVAVERA
jgi:hypothetical protein